MMKRFPFAPFALVVFPILAMLGYNLKEVSINVVIRPIIVGLVGALILLIGFRLILRSWGKASVLSSFLVILFFSYGQVYGLLEQHPIGSLNLGRHRYLMIIYGVILVIGLWALIFKLERTAQVLYPLNIISLLLLVFPLAQLSLYSIQSAQQQRQASTSAALYDPPLKPQLQPLPDVYYIVLDSHTRSDALRDDYGLDNSIYLDQLRQLGFYIADCSRSNYGYTQASIVAALDMDYLQNLRPYMEQLNTSDIWLVLKQSRVRQLFENLGYKTVAFDTGYKWSQLEDADIYLSVGRDSYSMQKINPFEAMLIKSTALLILTDSQSKLLQAQFQEINFPFSYHVTSQKFILEQLPLIASDPDPTFTFAHILIPHVPFVFNPDGSLVDDPLFYSGKLAWPGDDEHRRIGYSNEVEFIDQQMVQIFTTILAKSTTPPIVVIHGDHGLINQNRYEILNAYYLPGDGAKQLYPSISPVNSFRVIFDTYFGAHYGLTNDASYSDTGELMPETSPDCQP